MSHFEHETMKLVMANIETDTTLKLMLTPSFTLGLLAHAPFVSQHGSTLPHNDDRRKMAPMVMIGDYLDDDSGSMNKKLLLQQLLNKYI